MLYGTQSQKVRFSFGAAKEYLLLVKSKSLSVSGYYNDDSMQYMQSMYSHYLPLTSLYDKDLIQSYTLTTAPVGTGNCAADLDIVDKSGQPVIRNQVSIDFPTLLTTAVEISIDVFLMCNAEIFRWDSDTFVVTPVDVVGLLGNLLVTAPPRGAPTTMVVSPYTFCKIRCCVKTTKDIPIVKFNVDIAGPNYYPANVSKLKFQLYTKATVTEMSSRVVYQKKMTSVSSEEWDALLEIEH